MGKTMPAFNTVAWFEIASDDPEAVERFYGDLFGWEFTTDENSAKGGMDYRMINYAGETAPSGGVFGSEGKFPNHGVFSVVVEDVAATCEKVESLGGKVIFKLLGKENGTDFAYFHDTTGNLFQVFAPPSA
jgi:predicted enzyme related to lactoylglutathione lyase